MRVKSILKLTIHIVVQSVDVLIEFLHVKVRAHELQTNVIVTVQNQR